MDETNINKDVYIINGPYYIIDEDTILKGYDLKEINENNVLMYINGVETKFEKHKKSYWNINKELLIKNVLFVKSSLLL